MPDAAGEKTSFLKSRFIDRSDLLALFICVGAFFCWLNLLIEKFVHFGYYDWDLAMYAQATWAISQGSLYSSIFGTNFLTNHAEYIAFFLAPICKIFPSTFTMIVFKILSLTGGSFVFYLIAKKLVGWRLAIVLMLLYLVHPANAFMMIYEFHYENLAIIFIFLMFYFLQNQRLFPFLISAFFATLVKENISLVVFMFGLYVFILRKPKGRIWVIGPIILGLGFFLLTMFVITPYLRVQEGITSSNQYISMYWNNTITASPLQTLSQNFINLWHKLISPMNLHYMRELFLPFHIITFLSPWTLLLGAPIFLQHFLSPASTNHSMFYHYAATAIIFIFLATAQSLVWVKKIVRPIFFSLIIMTTVGGYCLYLNNYLPEFKRRVALWNDHLDPIRQNMILEIPDNKASIVTSFDFLGHLANRPAIFSFHNVWQNYATFTGKTPFPLPKDLAYALIDWKCPWLWGDLLSHNSQETKEYLKRINNFYFSRQWFTVDAIDDITLLSTINTGLNPMKLVENSLEPFSSISPEKLSFNIGENLKLLSLAIKTPNTKEQNILPLEFIWHANKPTDDFIAVKITILNNGKIVARSEHALGYTFNATPLWQAGQYVRENYNLLLPVDLPTGEYILKLSFINYSKNQYEPILFQNQKLSSINFLKFTIRRGEHNEK